MHHWSVHKNLDDASQAAADFIAERIKSAIEERGVCHVIVPGGSTPVRCFNYLAVKDLPWSKVYWYPGDERCYPVGHAERNDVMLQDNLLTKTTGSHFQELPAELGAEQAALVYREVIAGVGRFDVAFLGMGEDGHTASLFPDNAALENEASVVAVHDAPKPPADRVSMGISTLFQARVRVVLTSGESKATVVGRVRAGEALPVNSIGDINWFIDEACLQAVQ